MFIRTVLLFPLRRNQSNLLFYGQMLKKKYESVGGSVGRENRNNNFEFKSR